MSADHAREVRSALTDPAKLCRALGLDKNSKSVGGGLLICCPWHGEKNPSCSVKKAKDGTLSVKCFACQETGDALHLVAQVYGLDLRANFREVLAEGAQIAGLLELANALRAGRPAPENRPRPAPPEPEPEREYPPADEVTALWLLSKPCADDRDASGALVRRRVDPEAVDRLCLARVLPGVGPIPDWAKYQGKGWRVTGHRLIIRAFDPEGRTRSVRAWRVREGDSPKRLPPAGHRTSGLILANRAAVAMLVGRARPERIVVVEGEPDFLVHAVRDEYPVIGLFSGSWTEAFAEKVPRGTEVVIRTHADEAGERYAEAVARTLGEKCPVWRAA